MLPNPKVTIELFSAPGPPPLRWAFCRPLVESNVDNFKLSRVFPLNRGHPRAVEVTSPLCLVRVRQRCFVGRGCNLLWNHGNGSGIAAGFVSFNHNQSVLRNSEQKCVCVWGGTFPLMDDLSFRASPLLVLNSRNGMLSWI